MGEGMAGGEAAVTELEGHALSRAVAEILGWTQLQWSESPRAWFGRPPGMADPTEDDLRFQDDDASRAGRNFIFNVPEFHRDAAQIPAMLEWLRKNGGGRFLIQERGDPMREPSFWIEASIADRRQLHADPVGASAETVLPGYVDRPLGEAMAEAVARLVVNFQAKGR